MSDAEIGALVRRALEHEGVLSTLILRRGYDDKGKDYSATLHVYADYAENTPPELGVVRNGMHLISKGHTLEEALQGLP